MIWLMVNLKIWLKEHNQIKFWEIKPLKLEVIRWKCRYVNVDMIQVFVIIISNFEMRINAGVSVKN